MQDHAPAHGAIGENNRLYKGGEFVPFYKPRELMPQVDDKAYPALRQWLAGHGVSFRECSVAPSKLKPHQRISVSKAHAMPASVVAIPLLVSSDGYIIDGNHRWFNHSQVGEPCAVIRIGLPFNVALAVVFEFLSDVPAGKLEHELSLVKS